MFLELSRVLTCFPRHLGRTDLRTDGAKRVRIANRLSGMHVSAKSETLRAWSKSKTGIKGEGLKVGIAQLVRDDMCRHRF